MNAGERSAAAELSSGRARRTSGSSSRRSASTTTSSDNHRADRHLQPVLRGPRRRSPERRSNAASRARRTTGDDARGGPHAIDRAALDAELQSWSTSCASASPAASGSTSASRRSPAPQTFADTNGYAIDLDDEHRPRPTGTSTNTPSSRSGYQYTFDETLNWQKGKHSITFGGGAFLGRAWDDSQQMVPGIDLRLRHHQRSRPPACSRPRNFPGASGGPAHRRARAVRAADRARRRRHRPGGARPRDQPVHLPRQPRGARASSTSTRCSCRTRGA